MNTNTHKFINKLSDLTPDIVDSLYGINSAEPQASPTFILLIGAPGVGKSSGHSFVIKEKYIPEPDKGGYATINLDTLLESLLPFRVGSSMGHLLKTKYPVHADFHSIFMYDTTDENLRAFGWYDDLIETKTTGRGAAKTEVTTTTLKAKSKILKEAADANSGKKNVDSTIAADPAKAREIISKLDFVRTPFLILKGKKSVESLIEKNKEAIKRAIMKSIPTIYETTLSVSRKVEKDTGKVTYECVKKFDELIRLLYGADESSPTCKMPAAKPKKVSAAVGGAGAGANEEATNIEEPSAIGPQYNLIVLHLTPERAENVAIRMKSRQESGMPYEKYPYYRYVPPSLADDQVEANRLAVETITTQYADLIAEGKLTVKTIVIPMDPGLLPKKKNFNADAQIENIIRAYGTTETNVDNLSRKLSAVSLSNTVSPNDSAGIGPTTPIPTTTPVTTAAMGGAGSSSSSSGARHSRGGARHSRGGSRHSYRRRINHRRRATNKRR